MGLIGLDGGALRTQETIAIAGDQVTWFLDGTAFLDHLADLHTVRVHAHCRTCAALGTPRPVGAALDRAHGVAYVRCGHRAGEVRIGRSLDLAQLLLALDWDLVCPRCAEPLRGDNSPSDPTWRIDCGCTTRVYVPPVVPPPVGSSARGRVGGGNDVAA